MILPFVNKFSLYKAQKKLLSFLKSAFLGDTVYTTIIREGNICLKTL